MRLTLLKLEPLKLFAALLLTGIMAAASADSTTANLADQQPLFSGRLAWTRIAQGTGINPAALENLTGAQAYEKLHQGKSLNELPDATLERYEITSGSVQNSLRMIYYQTQSAPEINVDLARKLVSQLNEEETTDTLLIPQIGLFEFAYAVIENKTSHGLTRTTVKPGARTSSEHSEISNADHLLSGPLSPLAWFRSKSEWKALLRNAERTSLSNQKTQLTARLDATEYTIILDEKQLPMQINYSTPMPGGWERQIELNYDNWHQHQGIMWYGTELTTVNLSWNGKSVPLSRTITIIDPIK